MTILNPNKVYRALEELKISLSVQNAEYLSLEETAQFLKLKKSYLYNLVYKKQIPHFKPSGKRLLFRKEDLIEWVESSKIKSVAEVESEISNQNQL